jgi:hypothetical protein
MSYLTGDATTKIRYATDLLPVTAAASGQGNSRFVATNDDNKTRRLTGVLATYQTKNLRFHIRVAGKEIAVIDANLFAQAAGWVPLDQVYLATQQLEYTIDSPAGSAAAIVANTDEITFRYEAAPDISPVG